jgi:hypothetical protein
MCADEHDYNSSLADLESRFKKLIQEERQLRGLAVNSEAHLLL